jgi:spore germination protein KA
VQIIHLIIKFKRSVKGEINLSEQNNAMGQSNNTPKLTNSLADNITLLRDLFKNNQTVRYREFQNRINSNIKCCIIYTDGMINKELVEEHIILPVMEMNLQDSITPENILDILMGKVLISGDVKKINDVNEIAASISYGDTLLLADTATEALVIDTKGWPVRAIEEPSSEKVVRGSREGFTESIMSNLTMIRRRILVPELKTTFKELGTRTKTKIALCYIEGIAQDKILNELIKRLDKIDIDGILESKYIEEYIKDAPFSLFDTIGYTESPDIAVGKLLEGRIILVCDGTPFVLTLPFLFIEYFYLYEDYYSNYIYASFNRLLRILALSLGISIPALYVGIVTFHKELIPTSLFLSISASRKGIPLPTLLEAFVMLIGFSMLREAGIRLPKPIGQAISIIGALVLGDAAVNARIISAPMVIVIASTGIASFLVPKMLGVFIDMQVLLLILASVLGLYGYFFGIMGLVLYLMSLRSFGVPYMLYSTMVKVEDLKDTTIRVPWFLMNFRPKFIAKDRRRTNDIGKSSKGR